MLEKLRKSGASVLIYVLFGILIAGFVINFGPQSGGSSQGCTGGGVSADTVMEVDGEELGRPAWRFAYNARAGRNQVARAEAAMEDLLRSQILAAEAAARGLVVSDGLIDRKIKAGEIYLVGRRWDLQSACESGQGPCYFKKVDDQWFFDFEILKAYLNQLGLSMGHFKDNQRREILADMVADLLRGSASASRDEALARFIHENTTVAFDGVTFAPAAYKAALKVGPADIERFLASHEAEVKAKYTADERLYKGLKPQAQLRQIFVAKAPAPAPADPADPTATAASTAADPGKAQLEAIRTEITSGKKTFAAVAATSNDTEAHKASSGDLGWRTVESPALPDPALNDAVKALKKGDVSPVIETSRGFYLLTVEDTREGDLSFDQVKGELALELARDVWSKEAAKRAALDALAQARAGTGKNLSELFQKAKEPAGGGGFEGLENLSPEDRERLLEQIRQMQQQQGSLTWESQDIPAEWQQGAEAQPAPAAAPAAAPTAAPAAAPAAPAAAAPAATDAAAGAPAAAPAVDGAITPSADVLPPMGEVAKPELRSYGPMVRDRESIPRLGKSAPLMKALFDELTPGMLAPRVYEVDGSYVLVQVSQKEQAKIDEFEKDADRRVASLVDERGEKVLESWLAARCKQLVDAKKIDFQKDLVTEFDDQGKPVRLSYQPCQSMQ
jgi:parvulin-like peptidyl-prolyl isomerase